MTRSGAFQTAVWAICKSPFLVEAIAVVCVAAYWIWRTPFLAKLLARLFVVQIVIGIGFLPFILFFFFTWRPKMM